MDIQATLNLPRTDFPMRAGLPKLEPKIQEHWTELRVYERLRRERAGAPRFVLHDGPPYANGDIHIGTAMNKILKDFIVRYQSLKGYDAPFVPGWDTHGLPIELKALQGLGKDWHEAEPLEVRAACRDYALHYAEIMTRQFQRLGILGDWEHPYVTLDPDYEARQVEVFGLLAARGFIYRGLRPVYWCPVDETALADAEVEFQDVRSPSIHVAFPVAEDEPRLPRGTRVAVWTTTPWTLPANVAIALQADAEYVVLDTAAGPVLVAAARVPAFLAATGLQSAAVLARHEGRALEGVACRHPFIDRRVPIVLGEHVTLEEGTGCVHTAPGHGQEDFEVGRRYGLPVVQPLDARGRFTAEGGEFAGLRYDEANPAVLERLRREGALLAAGEVEHAYAHCWRCKNPVVWRATAQWFASVEGFRRQALDAIDAVRWIPSWGATRIRNMVERRGDWCISRQRTWGVPIPIFYCESCGEPLVDEDVVRRVAGVFRAEGSDAWFSEPVEAFLASGETCPTCGGTSFRKERDIMDVWFDSGSSHAAVLEGRPGLSWPADLYLEGSDQHRGWFQSSLLTAVATRGAAPYRAVLTHGFVVDGEGRKMSKSLGNVIVPAEVVGQYGADILRLWVASADTTGDVRVSADILKQLSETYRKVRNTLRFLMGNLDGFDVSRPAPGEARQPVDRWVLARCDEVMERVDAAYAAYEFHQAFQAIHAFCVNDLSAFYLDVLKDRLYTSGPEAPERRAAQAVLEHLLRALVVAVAPLIPHTADEAWGYMPHRAGDPESVQLAAWPAPSDVWLEREERDAWATFFRLREAAMRALEAGRAAGTFGASRAARLVLRLPEAEGRQLAPLEADLADLLGVARVDLDPATDLEVVALAASGVKCERCWTTSEDVAELGEMAGLCGRCRETVTRFFATA